MDNVQFTIVNELKPYGKYKKSQMPWIGELPEHWNCEKLYTRFKERRVKVSDKDYKPLSVTKLGIVLQLSTAAKSNDGDNRKLVKRGDFVFNSRSDRKGSSGLSGYDGSVSLINTVLEPYEINSKYAHYLLKSNNFIEEFYRNGRGIVADLWTTRFYEMRNIYIPIPSRTEQDQIVKYLDNKLAKINKFIKAKKKLITVLKEQKQAVINEAVTKGLNPGVKMKPSGIEWLEEIPESWDIRYLFQVTKEQFISNKEVHHQNLLSLSYGNIIQKNINKTEGLLPESFDTYQIVNDGNIILRLTDLQNDHKSLRIGLVTQTGIITSAYVCLNTKSIILPKYLYFLLHSFDVCKVFYGMGSGVRQGMSYKDIKKLKILLPSLSEQHIAEA